MTAAAVASCACIPIAYSLSGCKINWTILSGLLLFSFNKPAHWAFRVRDLSFLYEKVYKFYKTKLFSLTAGETETQVWPIMAGLLSAIGANFELYFYLPKDCRKILGFTKEIKCRKRKSFIACHVLQKPDAPEVIAVNVQHAWMVLEKQNITNGSFIHFCSFEMFTLEIIRNWIFTECWFLE